MRPSSMCLVAGLLILCGAMIAEAANCPRSLGCGLVGCKCGDTVVSNFTMNMDITCPQSFTDPTYGLQVAPGVTLDGKDASTGQIHKIIGPGNPTPGEPNVNDTNVGISLQPNAPGGTPTPIAVQNIDVSGFERGVEIEIGSNGNTVTNIAAHDNGNFLASNANGYGIDVLGSDNVIDGCQIFHNADEGIHCSSSVPEGAIEVTGTCSVSGGICTENADCPAGETCVVTDGARNVMQSTVAGASQVYDNGRENIYVRITSATKVVDTTSSYPGGCGCTTNTQATDCGSGGVCGTASVWAGRCIKGTPVACTNSCGNGQPCRHGFGENARPAYIKHAVDGIYRRNTFNDGLVEVTGNSRANFFGRPTATTGGDTFNNGIKFSLHPDGGGVAPDRNTIRYSTVANPSGPCVIFHYSSSNTLDHVQFTTCGASWDVQSDGFCEAESSRTCSSNGQDCTAQCNGSMCDQPGSMCTCENTGTICTANAGCACVNGECDQDHSIMCNGPNDCRTCAPTLPNGPNVVCDTALPSSSPLSPPAPPSLVLNGASCPP